MSVNSDLARLYGSESDAIYLAPIGTSTSSITLDSTLGAEFEEIGWLNTDAGVTESATGSKTQLRGHQGNNVVRTTMDSPGTTISFVALEDKPMTRELRYDVKSSTTSGGVREEQRGPGQKVQARVAVIDLFDADDETIKERWVIDRLEIIPNGDKTNVNSDIAAYPFQGEIIGDYRVLSTDLDDVS